MSPRVVLFAQQILSIRGKQGYVLRPSKANPRVKRWMKGVEQDVPKGRAALPWPNYDPERAKFWQRNLGQDWEALMEAIYSPTQGMLLSDYAVFDLHDPEPREVFNRTALKRLSRKR